MPHKIVITLNASSGLRRIRRFYGDPILGDKAVSTILSALRLLLTNPLTGRPVKNKVEQRERVITFGNQGFIALYKYNQPTDEVVVYSIRHQREAGYRQNIATLEQ
jgi:plasmid stabilization system protein ParE